MLTNGRQSLLRNLRGSCSLQLLAASWMQHSCSPSQPRRQHSTTTGGLTGCPHQPAQALGLLAAAAAVQVSVNTATLTQMLNGHQSRRSLHSTQCSCHELMQLSRWSLRLLCHSRKSGRCCRARSALIGGSRVQGAVISHHRFVIQSSGQLPRQREAPPRGAAWNQSSDCFCVETIKLNVAVSASSAAAVPVGSTECNGWALPDRHCLRPTGVFRASSSCLPGTLFEPGCSSL